MYAASSRYLAMAAMAAVAIRQVLAPKLSELLARRSTERASAAYQTTTSWLVALNWPIYLALLTFGPALLRCSAATSPAARWSWSWCRRPCCSPPPSARSTWSC